MATVIEFSGDEGHWVVVDEDVEAVRETMAGGAGPAVRLTHAGQGQPIYVNPAQVACWYAGVEGEVAHRPPVARYSDSYRPPRSAGPGQLRRALEGLMHSDTNTETADARRRVM